MSGRTVVTAAAPCAADRVTTLLEQAEQKRMTGDYRAGTELARQAAAMAESIGDVPTRAGALRSLANQLMRLGEQESAVTACREAIAALEGIGDERAICQVLTSEAIPLTDLGMNEEALEGLDRAREIAYRLGDQDLLYWVHNRIGVVQGSMGDYDLSAEYLMRALTMVEGMDDEARFCILNNVGDNAVHRVPLMRAAGDADGAEQTLSGALGHVAEALRLARAAGNPFRQAISLDNYGMLLALAGDPETAGTLIDEAQEIAHRHGYMSMVSATLRNQAHVRFLRGERTEAIQGLLEALERAVVAGEKPMAIEIHRELSEAYEQVGDFPAALRHYRTFHTLDREAHNDVAAARARMAVHSFELDNARLEAQLHRLRSAELEADNLSWQRQASEDALTGLPNRRSIEVRLPQLAAEAGQLCVALADVDLFKGVNDRFGHLVGDEVLRRIADLLRDSMRDGDPAAGFGLVARFGGEEFLIALGAVEPSEARARCEALRAQIAAYPWDQVAPGLTVTISIGLAPIKPGGTVAEALASADEHLYAAKHRGRNRVES
jgi:diguanylate cyclase (GGDEF)-like protein